MMTASIKTTVWLLVAGLLVMGLAGCSGKKEEEAAGPGQGEPVFPITVGEVTRGSITQTAPLIGSTRFGLRSFIKSEVDGRTLKLTVREGETFKKGDLLVKVDSGDYDTELLQVKAELQRAKRVVEELKAGTRQEVIDQLEASVQEMQARLDLAQDDLRRSETLFKDKVSTEAELTRDRSTVATAKAILSQAKGRLAEAKKGTREEEIQVAEAEVAIQEAKLKAVEREIAKSVITAPYDGVVLRRYTDLGNYLEKGSDVMEIASMDHVTALMEVPERFVRHLQPKLRFEVVADAFPGETFEVELIAVVPEADEQSRNLWVRCKVLNHEGKLLSGMFISGKIPVVSRDNVTLIPQDAVVLKDDHQMLFTVKGERVEMHVAKLGLSNATEVELLSPELEPGTQVVTTGGEVLFPNAKVMIPGQGGQPGGPPAEETSEGTPSSEDGK